MLKGLFFGFYFLNKCKLDYFIANVKNKWLYMNCEKINCGYIFFESQWIDTSNKY